MVEHLQFAFFKTVTHSAFNKTLNNGEIVFYAHNIIFNANMIEDWENCNVDPVQGFLQLSNKVEKGANEIQGLNQQLVSFNIRWLWKYLQIRQTWTSQAI